MMYMAEKIKKEHLHPRAKGTAGFHIVDVSMDTYKSRVCYFPFRVTIKDLSDAFRTARKDQKKSMVQVAKHLSKHLQNNIWSFD